MKFKIIFIFILFTGKPSTDPGHPDYAPSIFNFTPGPVPTKTPTSVDRFERLSKRRRRLILSPLENDLRAEADAADALLGLGLDLPQSAEGMCLYYYIFTIHIQKKYVS